MLSLAFLYTASWPCNVQLLNKQTKKDSHFNLDDFVLHNMSIFYFFWSQSVCYFFAISEVMKWFMVLLELKSTQTIQNCEQSLLLLRGKTPRHLCFSKTHRGSIPVWKCNGCVSPPELNLYRLISREIDHCILLAGTVGWPPECMICPFSDTGHLCGNTLYKGRILEGSPTSVLVTPICSSMNGT